jgi:hypothetical protein
MLDGRHQAELVQTDRPQARDHLAQDLLQMIDCIAA